MAACGMFTCVCIPVSRPSSFVMNGLHGYEVLFLAKF